MSWPKVKTEATGKAGSHSSRWASRAIAKDAAKRLRRAGDRRLIAAGEREIEDDELVAALDPNGIARDW